MTHRFHVPDASEHQEALRLPDAEARHLSRVLRLGPGASVQVFDGRGHEFRARVRGVDRVGVLVDTLESVAPARETRVAITLAQAVLKGRKFDTVIRDATMLGVSAIQPIVTDHTDVPSDATQAVATRARWQRVAVASAKQCRRAVVPVIGTLQSFRDHLHSGEGVHIVFVEPKANTRQPSLDLLSQGPPPDRATLTIGPEGGWSDEELDHARAAGCKLLTVGTRTLRADATPVAVLSVVLYLWGEL